MEHSPIILSILICSLEARGELLFALLAELNKQMENRKDIEILVETDSGEMTVGTKRNTLLSRAQGEYICFIDDDDSIAPNYILSIMKALEKYPDCVGIEGVLRTTGNPDLLFKHSIQFQGWYTGVDAFYRTPNHLNPVKRKIAIEIGFPCKDFGEDHWYSNAIQQRIKTEEYINYPIYIYNKAD